MGFLWRSALLLQIFEWYAMLYIIKIQENKHVGEIYYEHNAENVDKLSISSNEISNRRQEIKIRRWFYVIFVVISLMHIFLDIEVYHSEDWFPSIILMAILGFYCITLIYLYVKISSIMLKKHWFEFQRIKREMKIFLYLSIFTILAYGSFDVGHRVLEGAFNYLNLWRCDKTSNQLYY